MLFLKDFLRNLFQLTPSRRATTQQEFADRLGIFQLTPSRRATSGCGLKYVLFIFQLTPSRRATKKVAVTFDRFTFQLTPSRRATGHLCHGLQRHGISTHALTEGDNIRPLTDKVIVISTHALTEGDEPSQIRFLA